MKPRCPILNGNGMGWVQPGYVRLDGTGSNPEFGGLMDAGMGMGDGGVHGMVPYSDPMYAVYYQRLAEMQAADPSQVGTPLPHDGRWRDIRSAVGSIKSIRGIVAREGNLGHQDESTQAPPPTPARGLEKDEATVVVGN